MRSYSAGFLFAFVLASVAQAGQSLFWLQTDGAASHLGSVQNPQITVSTGQTVPLYLWLHKDSLAYGFDGISLDVKLISSDTGRATATLTWDEPAGRWYGTTSGGTRSDSGGTGVDDSNAIDLTNTDTLGSDPLRLATINITGNAAGTVQLFLCVGAMGIADGGNNAVVWFGLASNSTGPDQQYISGGVPNLCSSVPEAAITVVAPCIADFDGDQDVDQTDFAHLQNCLLGSIVPQTDPACQDANLNGDTFVDDADVTVFIHCLSGPNVLPPADCY